jgi:predicted nucleic acid-binding protein
VGLVLDSSVVIAAERQARPVSDLLSALQATHGEHEILLSSISVLELEHGLHRAHNAELLDRRRAYLDTVFAAIPVQPFTKEMAQLAGRIDAEARAAGRVIPFPDLLIGTTALHAGYALVTANARHFQMVPGLVVLPA